MPKPLYRKPKVKIKTYKDYLKEYEKEGEDKGIETISDRFTDYLKNRL